MSRALAVSWGDTGKVLGTGPSTPQSSAIAGECDLRCLLPPAPRCLPDLVTGISPIESPLTGTTTPRGFTPEQPMLLPLLAVTHRIFSVGHTNHLCLSRLQPDYHFPLPAPATCSLGISSLASSKLLGQIWTETLEGEAGGAVYPRHHWGV